MLYNAGSSNRCSVTTLRGRVGWEVGRKFKREVRYVYLWLIPVGICQKPIQYCKAIIFQLKITKIKRENPPVIVGDMDSVPGLRRFHMPLAN